MNSVRTAGIIVAPPRCYEMQALLEGKKLWGPASSLYLRSEKTGVLAISAILVDAGRRGDAAARLSAWNPIHALLSGESGERQSLQPLVSSLAERDIYRRQRRSKISVPYEEAQVWWQCPPHSKSCDRRARCAMVDYAYRYR